MAKERPQTIRVVRHTRVGHLLKHMCDIRQTSPRKVTLAGPTLLCDIFNGLLPKNSSAEPNEPVSLADILSTLNKTRHAIIASIPQSLHL